MRKTLTAIAAALLGATLAAPAAHATDSTIPVVSDCLTGWYVNPDETLLLPEQIEGGLEFDGKDLIHHATTPIDFADFDKTSKSFQASTPGKVVFKAETSGPYGNIVINADGKLWSTAFKPDAVGGQGSPVDKATDLIGHPESMKPGKDPYTSASRIVTFGVGYWVEDGSTVVSSITFHGTTYDLTCKPEPDTSASSSSSAPKPTTTSTGATPTTTSSTTAGGTAGQGGQSGGGLPVTGPGGAAVGAVGLLLVVVGVGLFVAVRRRRARFVA